jgi:uncharacterized protein (DUF2336 family)
MTTTRTALTDADIDSLMRGATVDERAAAAQKLCLKMDEAGLDDEETEIAREILRVMASDAAELVRRALAVTLRASTILPRDIALKLAGDVDSVATPVLTYSPAFSEQDLIEIIQVAGPVRQIAIAKRSSLPETITTALVEHGAEVAVRAACANDNAMFAETSLQKAISRFASSQDLLAAVAYRRVLPLSVVERLVSIVGDKVRDHLVNHHALSPELAVQVAASVRERATIDLVDQAGRTADVEHLTQHLSAQGRLTPSLLLRALVHGHMSFFEWGLATLAKVPHHRTWLMIHDAGPLGLKAIYDRAALPARLYSAFRVGVDTFHSMEFEGSARDQARFQERMLERFLTQPTGAPREDVEYLLDKMDRTPRTRRSAGKPKALAAAM